MTALSTATEAPRESLLVFSDVHLGSDLNDAGNTVPRSKAIDDDLAAMLAHYRKAPPAAGADRWRVIAAGDFIDFIGISIDPRDEDREHLKTELTRAEREFGLGGAEDHVLLKLRRAVERHASVFEELGAFIAGGHALTVIHGNHDLELHWPNVQTAFCEHLARLAKSDVAIIAARVEFRPWFFHRDGLVFIEHGHQYDPFCATPYILAPLCPRDPNRVNPTLSDSLLRHIVRRTPGMKEYGHEERGLASYISWGLMLGARGTIDLFRRFFFIVFELREIARAYTSENGKKVREEHERRLRALSEETGVSEERLREALSLHCTPLGVTPRGVLTSVMLDRLSVFAAMVIALILIAVTWPLVGTSIALPMLVALLALWVVVHVLLSRGRPNVDPRVEMEVRTPDLARLFPASFIVMGHTHIPTTKSVREDITYINLGSWAEEEPDPKDGDVTKAYRAARTHLVVHADASGHHARLYEWHNGEPRIVHEHVRPAKSAARSREAAAAE